MSPATSIQVPEVKRGPASIAALGRVIFSLAIVAIGIETFVCARVVDHSLGPEHDIIPVIPWVPAMPWLAYLFGALWVACGIGLLTNRTVRPAALALGGLLILCALVLEGLNLLQRWAATGLGVMFGIWVITLHLPRVLGLYHIPNASSPNGWSSLFDVGRLVGVRQTARETSGGPMRTLARATWLEQYLPVLLLTFEKRTPFFQAELR